MIALGTLYKSDTISAAHAINDCGHIVGFTGNNSDHNATTGHVAFMYANGKMQNLGTLVSNRSAFTPISATEINNHGQIVGRGSINGESHAFLLTPHDVKH